jgi:hypothetical protein
MSVIVLDDQIAGKSLEDGPLNPVRCIRTRSTSAAGTVRSGVAATLARTRTLEARASVLSAARVECVRTRSLSVIGRVNDDPNRLARVECIRTRSTAIASRQKIGAKAILIRNRSTEIGARLQSPDEFFLEFVLDTLADEPTADIGGENGIVLDSPRLTYGPVDSNPADWIELPIGEWTYTEAEGTASSSVEFLLARPEDIGNFNVNTRYEFSVAQRISGAWDESTVHRLIPNGEYRGSRHVVSWENGSPGDNIRVRIESDHDAKLAKTAETDLIIYDDNRDDVDETTLEPVFDTLGNTYFPEVLKYGGLTLHSLFQLILVDRCEFAEFYTNIPDYPIKRYDCAMGASLYEALKPTIGMFDPVIYPDGHFIWIVDTSVTVPAGFPAARNITTSVYKQYADDVQNEKLDAFLVQFLEESADYDYVTPRIDTVIERAAGNTVTTIERIFIQYRKYVMPDVVLAENLDKETRTTKVNGATVAVTVDDLTYERRLLVKRVKTTRERLPDLNSSNNLFTLYTLQETERETETYTFRQHPFKPRQRYVAQKLTAKTGLILIDTENKQFSEDFESQYRTAWRSGNVYEGMTVRRGPIHSRQEASVPLQNGQVRTHVIETDELKNLVVLDYTEERAGDIGLGTAEGQQRRLVFESEDVPPVREPDKRIETMHIGEVPIAIGIPLARRKLKARRTSGNSSLQLDSIGIDRNWKRGSTVSLRGRKDVTDEPEFLGNFITLGRSYSGGPQIVINASYTLRKI